MSHQPSVMPSGPTEPDADRLRILLDNLNNLRSRLKSFAVIDQQGQAIGTVQDLILDAGHQLNLVIAQSDISETGYSFLLDGRQIQKVSVQAQSVFVDIAQTEVGSLPVYQTYQLPEESSPSASEIEDLFADTPEQPELTLADTPEANATIAALDDLGDLPEPESPATDSFASADWNSLELETTPPAIEEDVSFADLTADQSPSDNLDAGFSLSDLVDAPSAEDLSNLDLGTLNATQQLTGADFGGDLDLTDLSFSDDSLTATPEFPETEELSTNLENLDLSAEPFASDELVGLEDLELPVTEPPRDEDSGFSELLSANDSPEPSLNLDLSELNGSSAFDLAIDESVTEESLVDDFNLGASFSPEAITDNALEFNLEDSEPFTTNPADADLDLDLAQDNDFDLNLEDTGGLADLELPMPDAADTGFSLDQSLLVEEPAAEAAIDLDLLDESESLDLNLGFEAASPESDLGLEAPAAESDLGWQLEESIDTLDLGLAESTPDLDLNLESSAPESGFELELDDSTNSLDLGLEESTPDLNLGLAASDDLADLSFEPSTPEPAFDLGLESSTDALDLGLEESTPDLNLDLEVPATEPGFDLGLTASDDLADLNFESPEAEPGFDLGLESSTDALDLGLDEPTSDLDLSLETPEAESGFDFGLEEAAPDLDLNLESSASEAPGFDFGLESSTDTLDLGLDEPTPDLDLSLETPEAESGFDFSLEESAPDLDLNLESSAPEAPGFDFGLESSTDTLDLGLDEPTPDLDLSLETPEAESGFDFGLEEAAPDLDLNLESSAPEAPGFDFGLESLTDTLDLGLDEPTPDLDLDLETPEAESGFDFGLESSTDALDLGLDEPTPDLDLSLETPEAESGFDFGLEESAPDLDLNLEAPAPEAPGFDFGLESSTDALDLGLDEPPPDLDLSLETPEAESGFDFGLEESAPDLDLNLEAPAPEAPGFDFGLEEPAPDLDLALDLETPEAESGLDLGLQEPAPSWDLGPATSGDALGLASEPLTTEPIDFSVDQTNQLTSFEELAEELPEVNNLSALDLAFSEPSGTFSTEDLGDLAAGTAVAGLGVVTASAFTSTPEPTIDDRVITEADLAPVTPDAGGIASTPEPTIDDRVITEADLAPVTPDVISESVSPDATIPPEALISPDTIIPPDTVLPDTVDEAIELLEERLKVDYKRRKIGDVIIRKQIETRMIQVPVRYEKLVIEQVSPEQKSLAEVDLTAGQPVNVELPDIIGQPTISGEFDSPKAANYVLSAITKTLNHRCKKVRVEIELEDDKLQQSYQEWLDRCIEILKNS